MLRPIPEQPNNRTGRLEKALTPDPVYRFVQGYSAALGFEISAHAPRATAATNAFDHPADIAKVQDWLGHANIATTRIYDHRKTRPEDSPTCAWLERLFRAIIDDGVQYLASVEERWGEIAVYPELMEDYAERLCGVIAGYGTESHRRSGRRHDNLPVLASGDRAIRRSDRALGLSSDQVVG